MEQKELKNRILKGTAYFRDIEPSKWNVSHANHAKVLLRLVESYLNGEEVHMTDLNDKPRNLVTFVENKVEEVKERLASEN